MAIWKTLVRPHLKCMHRQVAVFKKHVSFWLVSRVPEAIFLLLVLVLLMAWLSHPLIENRQSGETEAASTKICIPHAEFPQGISVNVASNESTPFLIGLDVLREYGLVIDYHYNRVYSHILKRYFPSAIHPTEHLALEMLPSNSE